MVLSTCTHILTALKMRTMKNNETENEKEILANLRSNIVSMGWISISGSFTYLYNQLNPENLSLFPNYLIVFFCHLWLPQILSYATIIIYYRGHTKLQVIVWKEAVEIIYKVPWVQKLCPREID